MLHYYLHYFIQLISIFVGIHNAEISVVLYAHVLSLTFFQLFLMIGFEPLQILKRVLGFEPLQILKQVLPTLSFSLVLKNEFVLRVWYDDARLFNLFSSYTV